MRKLLLYITCVVTGSVLAQSNIQQGDSLYSLGNFKKAASFYEKDTSAKGKLKLAKTYKALGDIPRALSLYHKVVKEDPKLTIASYQYASLLAEIKKYKKADSLYSKLYMANPDQLNFLYQRGVLQEKQGNADAYATYEILLRKDSLYSNANYRMARYLVQKRQFEDALPYINRGLTVTPESRRFLILQGLFYNFTDQYYKAVAIFEQLIKLGHTNEQIHETLAKNYMEVLALNSAIEQYSILLKNYNSKNPTWHYQMGRAYYGIGDNEKAISHINTSIAIKDMSLDTEYLLLSSIYKKEKNYQKVFEMLGNALKENPDSEMLSYQHAIASDNYFEDTKSIINYYKVYLDKFPKGRFTDLAKQRISDLKTKDHLDVED